MKNIFTKHPKSVGESYFKHFFHAIRFSGVLLILSFKALIHAILPFLYETKVSERVKSLSDDMQKRKDKSKKNN